MVSFPETAEYIVVLHVLMGIYGQAPSGADNCRKVNVEITMMAVEQEGSTEVGVSPRDAANFPTAAPLAAEILRGLAAVVGEGYLLTDIAERALHAYDATIHRFLPDAVVRPANLPQVAAVLRLCQQTGVTVVPRGSATGLSGGALPVQGGVVLDLTRINRIREINVHDMYAIVETGVTVEHFSRAVAEHGLFFPPDPSAARASTMGGGLAENAGGPHAFKYGVFRDYTLGLTAVKMDGTVVRTGGKTVKNVSGYDLTRLLVGSEGTLAVIVEATMRLIAQPKARRTLLMVYDRLDDAAQTVSEIIAAGMQPAALEFIDDASIRVVEQYLHLGLPLDAEALLLVEVDGANTEVAEQTEQVQQLCRKYGARSVTVAASEAEAAQLWKARKSIASAVARIKPSKVSEDATVPRSQIPAMVRRLKEIARSYQVDLVIFGHAGDGNLHPNIMCDESDPQEMERVWQAVAEIFAVTLELGGTLTGEHGVGTMKAPFMRWEHGEAGLAVMRAIKSAWDPDHLLNPGKIFPEEAPPWPIALDPWERRITGKET